MDRSPFSTNSCPTSGKDNSTLQSEGWIDATTNLVAAHDATGRTEFTKSDATQRFYRLKAVETAE